MEKVEQVLNKEIVTDYDKKIGWSKKIEFIDKILKKSKVNYVWLKKKKQPYQLSIIYKEKKVVYNLYVSCVTHLGKPWPKFKKRMQLSNSADKSYLLKDNTETCVTLLLGLYLYDENNPIIVAWDAKNNKYAGKSKSSHVNIIEIQNAMIYGAFQKNDRLKNNVYCFKAEYLKDFLYYNSIDFTHKQQFTEYLVKTGLNLKEYPFIHYIFNYLKDDLSKKSFIWDAKLSIVEMKDGAYNNWKQTEWPGFYFEFLNNNLIKRMKEYENIDQMIEMPGPKYNKTTFDGFYNIPWDLKVHSDDSDEVITNDLNAINHAIMDYGKMGFIILSGESILEKDHEINDWRNELKGGLSKYQLKSQKENKKHRKIKAEFKPKRITVITIDKEGIKKHSVFKGVKNSNDNSRNAKLVIKLNDLTDEEILFNELLDK